MILLQVITYREKTFNTYRIKIWLKWSQFFPEIVHLSIILKKSISKMTQSSFLIWSFAE